MSSKKDLAKIEKKETGVTKFDYGEDAGDGFQNMDANDYQVPYLNLLQALSKYCPGQDGEGEVEGAKVGALMNSVTLEVYPESIEFVPCYREKACVEWVDQDHGGGFVARHEMGCDLHMKALAKAGTRFGKLKNPDDDTHDLVETVYIFGLIVKPCGAIEEIVAPFSGSKLKVHRAWNTKIGAVTVKVGDRKVKPPVYGHLVRLGVFDDTQKKTGKKFKNYTIEPAKGDLIDSLIPTDSELYAKARAFKELVAAGTAQLGDEERGGKAEPNEDGGGNF